MTLRFLADTDFNFHIVNAARRLEPTIDVRTAQEMSVNQLRDPQLLDFAAAEGRVLLTHDRRTMLNHFRGHLLSGKSSPGLFLSPQTSNVAPIAEAIVIAWAMLDSAEVVGKVMHLPSLAEHVFPAGR